MNRPNKTSDLPRNEAPPLSPLRFPPKPLEGKFTALLALLIAVYVALAGLHAVTVPTGQTGYQNAPDEYAHVLYVQSLAAGHFPTPDDQKTEPRAYEWHQPPLYYLIVSRFASVGERNLRFFSIGFGVIALLLIFRTGRLLFPGSLTVPFLATALAAFTPTHIAITSVVNNDGLLEVGFSWALLVCVASLLSGYTLWRAGWLGLAMGVACLTKANGLLLFPVFFYFLWLLRKSGESPKTLVRHGGWTLLVAFAICGGWFLRNKLIFGEFYPLHKFEEMFRGTIQAQDVVAGKVLRGVEGWGDYAKLVAQWSYQSFFAVYGTPRSASQGIPQFLQPQIYLLVGLFLAGSIYGLIRLHFEAHTETTPTQRYALWVLVFVLGCIIFSFGGFVLKYFQAQGRYLFPAMLPISLLLAAGYDRATRGKYRGLLMAYGVLVYLALCATFFLTIR